ncbi:histone H1B [Caerostris darwini]|uniref:Histone H1B n=1 Tax=Caerostris darwini TaxID=1538125 RepID=A0AAV4QGW0_9ARAC|nr:histone H1B [Caerostris darwini]
MEESPNSPTKKAASSNPKISVMVITAITSLDEKNGSSLHAIKKFIGTQYKVDAEKMAVYIKKYLKKALENGELVQKTGKGANGSFAINKQKGIAKKTDSTRAKLLKMRTSTPKLLKPKKGKMQQPDESPVFRRDSDSSIEVRLTPKSTKVPAEKTKKPNVNGEKVKKPKTAGEKATKTKAAGEKATKTKAAGEKPQDQSCW